MEVPAGFLVVTLVLSCFVSTSHGVYFSSLNETLIVTASPTQGQGLTISLTCNYTNPMTNMIKKDVLLIVIELNFAVLKAGENQITVTWRFNQSYRAGTDSNYKTVKVKLCYAPISQKDRSWRKTEDHLKKDKTCQHKIVARPYAASNNSVTWTVERDIPTGVYFVRAYALDAHDVEVAYGQTTDAQKSTNLFEIQAITGRHVSLDIASVCFSAFSVVSLFGFFYMEKRKGKASQQK